MSIQNVFPRKYTGRTIPAMLLLLTLFSPTALLSANVCGDVNYDQDVNIGDVVYIISYIFKGGPPPQFLCDGDVNGDGALNVGDAVHLVSWIFKGGPPPVCIPGGGLADSSGCKLYSDPADSIQECLVYEYDGAGLLTLTHVNTIFNCCPGEIIANIAVNGNTIVINENEAAADCDCSCLYDLDMEIHYLEPGEYTIEVNNPYISYYYGSLVFTVNLGEPTADSYCRDYPSTGFTPPSGDVTEYGTCKFMKSGAGQDDPPQDQDCLQYTYDGVGVLDIQHLNAAFNCCPDELVADFSFDGNTITITENELLTDYCYCLCLFDVSYQLTGIPPGTYVIKIVGMYLENEPPLEVTIDLNAEPAGLYCVTRNIYPWN